MKKSLFAFFCLLHSFCFAETAIEALQSPFVYNSVNVITGNYCEAHTDLVVGPNAIILRRTYENGWVFNHPGIFSQISESLPEHPKWKISYEFDQSHRLIAINAKDESGNVGYWVHFAYDNGLCTAESNEGKKVTYKFTASNLLEEFSANGFTCRYQYVNFQGKSFIVRREEGNGRYVITEYFANGKVYQQSSPSGLLNQFIYCEGFTEVYDANTRKMVYRYSKEQKLTAIESYNEKNALYRAENFVWDNGKLTMRFIADAQGKVYSCHKFAYDAVGNIISETLEGNLSGSHNGESYTTTYRYQEEAPYLLLEKKEGNGTSTQFHYIPNSTQVSAKFIIDRVIKIRHFFFYNEHGELIKNFIDDGNTIDFQNLSGVTERKISSYTLNKHGPEIVEEKYFDFAENCEKILQRTINTYSATGSLQKKVVQNPLGEIRETQEFDDKGRIYKFVDQHAANTFYQYDDKGNILEITIQSKDGTTNKTSYTYDLADRLVQTKKEDAEHKISVSINQYDPVGNLIKMIDEFGNETSYEYDAFGRVISIQYPQVLDQNDIPYSPVELKEYDILDRVTKTIDRNGFSTETEFNVRGKPIKITHVDGTVERFLYRLDGTLQQCVNRNGIIIQFEHDFLGRVLQSTLYDASGQFQGISQSTYTSFHLLSSQEFSGITTEFTYTYSGRLFSEIKRKNNEIRKKECLYDQNSQLTAEKCWYDRGDLDYLYTKYGQETIIEDAYGNIYSKHFSSPKKSKNLETTQIQNARGQFVKQCSITDEFGCTIVTICDALQRPETILKKNSFGETLNHDELRYDPLGNKILHKQIGKKRNFSIAWTYGPQNRLESVVEASESPKQQITRYLYNSFGQLTTVVKPDSVSLNYIYDSLGRVSNMYSSENSINYSYLYDLQGNLLETTDLNNASTTSREYNMESQVIHETLANGLSIKHSYDMLNRKTAITFPDQSGVQYLYKGPYLSSIQRLDSTQRVQYTNNYVNYDLSGKNLISELPNGLGEIRFTYSPEGELISQCSPYWKQECSSGHSVITENTETTEYKYNERNQLIQEIGPKKVKYSYDEFNNRIMKNETPYQINERNQLIREGENKYAYNLCGCLTKKITPQESIEYKYDALHRLVSIVKPDTTVHYTYDPLGRKMSKTVNGVTTHFIYDLQEEIGSKYSDEEKFIDLSIRSPVQNSIVAIELENKKYATINNSQSSVACLIDMDTKKAVQTYRYTAFGETSQESKVNNPWLYAGKRYDEDGKFYCFNARNYDPTTGRWLTPDPMGYIDGLNRYSFAQNNPVLFKDPYGLFSISSLWDTVVDAISTAVNALFNSAKSVLNYFQSYFSFANTKSGLDKIAEQLFGKTFLAICGYYHETVENGLVGTKQYDKIRITAINGILNLKEQWIDMLQYFSNTHGNAAIHFIHHPTEGWTWDALKGLMIKFGYLSPQASLLADTWKKLIQEMGGVNNGGTILHYAHSIGGSDTFNALQMLSEEERKMLHIITIGSPSLIPDAGFGSVTNYRSRHDIISIGDPFKLLKSALFSTNVIHLGSYWGIPFIDHLLTMETYQRLIQMLGEDFVKNHT